MTVPARSRLRSGARWLAGLLALSWACTAASAPPAPQHWLDYAGSASLQFQAWLSDDADERVQRLHAWLRQRDTNDRLMGGTVPVVVQVWIAPDGAVQRLEFASLGQSQADADLRALLARRLATPPADMRQPLVLQLSVDPVRPDETGLTL